VKAAKLKSVGNSTGGASEEQRRVRARFALAFEPERVVPELGAPLLAPCPTFVRRDDGAQRVEQEKRAA
jgi:hypothetical protein